MHLYTAKENALLLKIAISFYNTLKFINIRCCISVGTVTKNQRTKIPEEKLNIQTSLKFRKNTLYISITRSGFSIQFTVTLFFIKTKKNKYPSHSNTYRSSSCHTTIVWRASKSTFHSTQDHTLFQLSEFTRLFTIRCFTEKYSCYMYVLE